MNRASKTGRKFHAVAAGLTVSMGGLIALLLWMTPTASAQPVVTGVSVDHISHSTARVHWTSSPATNRQVAFDTKAYWDANKTYRYRTPRWNQYETSQYAVISGLTPSTVYVASPLACDASANCLDGSDDDPKAEFTTSAQPGTQPVLPAVPDLSGFDTSYPREDATLNVSSDCASLQAQITAAAGAAYSGQTVAVVIPAGTTCQLAAGQSYVLPPKSGNGYVIIRSGGTLPVEGTRLNPETDAAQMATISNPNPGLTPSLLDTLGGTAHHYRFVGIKFTHPPIAGAGDVRADSQRFLLRMDGAIHHIILDRCWIHGRGYPDRAYIGWYGQQGSYIAFINNYVDNISIWRAYQSGITVTRNNASTNSYSAGTAYFGNASAAIRAFSVSLSGSGTGHFRLYVTRAGTVYFKHDIASGLTANCTGCTSSYDASLTVPDDAFKLVSTDSGGQQCDITNAQFKTAGGAATGGAWTIQDGSDTLGWEGATAFYMVDCHHVLAENNYIGATGIGFYTENFVGTEPTHDVAVVRNTFQSDPSLFVHAAGDSNRFGLRRQHVEFKQGIRVLVEGNTFLDAWSSVGGVPSPAVLLAVAGDSAHPEMGISDATIRNNLIQRHPSCFFVNGTNVGGAQMRLLQRLLIENNVCEADAYTRSDFTKAEYPWDGSMRGMQINLIMGGEDYTIRHNTFYGGLGYQPYFLKLTDLWFGGLTVQDNIFFLQQSAGGPSWGVGLGSRTDYADAGGTPGITANEGTAALNNAAIRIPSTGSWSFDHNVIVTGCTNAAACTSSTSGAGLLDVAEKSALYPGGNYWPTGSTYGTRIAAVGFQDPAKGDFRLIAASSFKAGGGYPASDNRDVGAVHDDLESALGLVQNVRVTDVGRRAAILQYTAPDGVACTVEYGTSPAAGSGSRIADLGGQRQRQVVLAGLAAESQYYYRILCATQQPSGTFWTQSGSEGPTSLPKLLAPPGGISVSEALVEYGPTPALGSATAAVGCAEGCTVTLPATVGQAIYHRAVYRDEGQVVRARGAVEASIGH